MASINKREYKARKAKNKGNNKDKNKKDNATQENLTIIDGNGEVVCVQNDGSMRPSDAKNADFHVHARDHSDGVMRLSEIIKKSKSVSWLSWLQHNSLSTWEEFVRHNNGDATRPIFSVSNISMVPAVEITCRDTGNTNVKGNPVKVHVLAYAPVLTEDSPLVRLLRIKSANDKLVDYGVLEYILSANGVLIDEDSIKNYVLNKREKDPEHGFNTFGTSNCMEFFAESKIQLAKSEREVEKILSSIPRIERLNLDLKDVIKIIHASGGFAVLAHPPVNLRRSSTPEITLQNFFAHEGDGLELVAPCTDQQSFAFLMDEVKKIESKNDILFTGGSDTHIPSKDASPGRFGGKYISCFSQRGMIDELFKLKGARNEGELTHRNYSSITSKEVEEILDEYEEKERKLLEVYDKNRSLHDGSNDRIIVPNRTVIHTGAKIDPTTVPSYVDYLRLTNCFASNGGKGL